MGLLAVTPAGDILHQLAQGLAGGILPQGNCRRIRGHQLGRRQLGGFQRQTSQQDRDPVKDRGQAEVGIAGGVAEPADHRQGDPGDGD